MAEPSSIAYPYAKAVCDLAKRRDNLKDWEDQLDLLADIVADTRVAALINNPKVTSGKLQEFILGIVKKTKKPPAGLKHPLHEKDKVLAIIGGFNNRVYEEATNLIKLLVRNKRLEFLPDIAKAYTDLRKKEEGVVTVKVTTAIKINARQQTTFNATLKEKILELGRRKQKLKPNQTVTIEFEFDTPDPNLIGGAVVRVVDWDEVMDGSVQAQLEQLSKALNI